MCPFVFDGVEVRGIGWEELDCVACLGDCAQDVGPFVDGCVVHDEDGFWRQFWQQILHRPRVEGISINIGGEEADGE